jgi:hypothetical protein
MRLSSGRLVAAAGVLAFTLVACDIRARPPGPAATTMPAAARDEPVEIKVFFDLQSDEEGVAMICPRTVSASGPRAGEIDLEILNRFDGEVFLEITGLEELSYSLQMEKKAMGSGSSVYLFPWQVERFWRLKGSSLYDGKRMTCGCGLARIQAKLRHSSDVDLRTWVGAKGTVHIHLRGYFRRTGAGFRKDVEIPIEIVK